MKRNTLNSLIPLFFLAACSSGGGGLNGQGNNNNPPPPTGLTIDSANGMQVSQVAYQSVISSGDLAGLAGGAGPSLSSGGGLAKPTISQQPHSLVAGILQKVPVGPTVSNCAAGGTLTVTMDIVDLNVLAAGALSAGDTILNEYAACDEGFGEVIDGDVDAEIDAFAGNILINIFDVTMTLDLTDFQVATAADVITSNGDATATLNSIATPYVEISVSGNSMTTDTNSGTETLFSFSSAQTLDAGVIPSPFTMVASGTLDTSQLDGVITYSTTVMFEGFDTGYPVSGELLIAGEGSSALIIAQANGVDVVIEIYSNETGTGTPDDTINTTWAELAAG